MSREAFRVISNIRNLYRLKKKDNIAENRVVKGIRALFETDDELEPKLIQNWFNSN